MIGRQTPTVLTVYFRHGCHLCTVMVEELAGLQWELDFTVTLCDVDAAPDLVDRHGGRVPVLAVGETELCHYTLDRERLREYCRPR